MDPSLQVRLPVLTIHGNHDDPSGADNLSAVDILAGSRLVNYFGKLVRPHALCALICVPSDCLLLCCHSYHPLASCLSRMVSFFKLSSSMMHARRKQSGHGAAYEEFRAVSHKRRNAMLSELDSWGASAQETPERKPRFWGRCSGHRAP